MTELSLAPFFAAQSRHQVLDRLSREPQVGDHDTLITPDVVRFAQLLKSQQARNASTAALFGTAEVLIVPGFLGSTLTDTGEFGLIWVDPTLVLNLKPGELGALKLGDFQTDRPETDAAPTVQIESRGAVPVMYDLLRAGLELQRFDVSIFPVDWRKNLEEAALRLAKQIGERANRSTKPLHLIAHSQGTIVARRALQLLGSDAARKLVTNLVLLGPATHGTFSAAFALAGSNDLIDTLQMLQVKVPPDFHKTLQSFTGLYQLLPWKAGTLAAGFDPSILKDPAFWTTSGIDEDRLQFGFSWASQIDTTFFNDRTTIILGDAPTAGAAAFQGGKLVSTADVIGDGTVPERSALIAGVRAFKVKDAQHAKLGMNFTVFRAVSAILRGKLPSIQRVALQGTAESGVEMLEPQVIPPTVTSPFAAKAMAAVPATRGPRPEALRINPLIPIPENRRLKVFSFDPLLATRLEDLNIAEITIDVPWEENLSLGPVGEYIEVVDYDPASDCFYRPVDLTDVRLVAQDGLTPDESNPQFHQQMAYAVSMSTIRTFEQALGRAALWAPRLQRNDDGEVIPQPISDQYVPRLRIYPHALRDENAYYDPNRHALVFGYFPSREDPGGLTMPGGTVFTCQSFDIVAHETTHALLHGLHRYYFDASNPDVFAFHEAFADAVALFQHFSHHDVVRDQIAKGLGRLSTGGHLGNLAVQFGQATAHRGGLRKYVNVSPDPALFRTTLEPHDRGAILMAAIFRAYLNIYEHRVKDLFRIASGGTGVMPDGAIHPDLVNRLTDEAVKAARHITTMCVRALDYVPPVDITFGEYLRALITADYDLVQNDTRNYRVAVIDAFRAWGIYPSDVNVLAETALRWRPLAHRATASLQELLASMNFDDWTIDASRREVFCRMTENAILFRDWLVKNAEHLADSAQQLGLYVSGHELQSIPRNGDGFPKFQIHSIRPCRRIGPDGQQRFDLVAELVQRRAGYLDPELQKKVDEAPTPWSFSDIDQQKTQRPRAPIHDFWFRGGCTLIIDPKTAEIRYAIYKSVTSSERLARQREYEATGAFPSLASTYYSEGRNPFAMLHAAD